MSTAAKLSGEARARILAGAKAYHGGHNVYHSRDACAAVLGLVEAERPLWWTDACSAFVQQVRDAPLVAREPKPSHPIVVVEGLDGVGKTTVTNALVERLQGTLVQTPHPTLEPLRALFRGLDEPIARAFYCGANYLAAPAIVAQAHATPLVVDRWWCSTCAMTLAGQPGSSKASIPAEGDSVYQWPKDLPTFDVGALLYVDESIRKLRMQRRNDENAEEALLAAKADMRDAAMAAYQRFGTLTLVEVPNYMVAVNTILSLVEERGFKVPTEARFTAEAVATARPY